MQACDTAAAPPGRLYCGTALAHRFDGLHQEGSRQGHQPSHREHDEIVIVGQAEDNPGQ
ncbi:hypothetical protein [Ktedonospora formicarum]|uniref:hypothetical protein n=1 Tax=Ktedonospora formicarum TaxID=2778364 RepID=UPI001C691D81|nr:hypothetical protein [Ktedonospora formicarum]